MKLVYTPKVGFAAPGNSWPTTDHDEKDGKVAKAKLDSGFYREKNKRASVPKDAGQKPAKRGSNGKGN